MENKTTATRMHNGVWTQSADRASTSSYNSKQQPRRKSGCYRIQQPKRKPPPSEYPTAYPLSATRAGAAVPDTAASYNSNRKRETERADTAVCRDSSIQRCVHAISTERTRAIFFHFVKRLEVKQIFVSSVSVSYTHLTLPTIYSV